jgi:hypothetical protein
MLIILLNKLQYLALLNNIHNYNEEILKFFLKDTGKEINK